MTTFSCVVIGSGSLLIGCCDGLLDNGHEIRVVISTDPDVLDWAANRSILVKQQLSDLTARFENGAFDWLFNINNLKRIPDAILALPKCGAIKFHNAPLPGYAGLNAPVWAIANCETRFGVTWHMLTSEIDRGDIVADLEFDIDEQETAFSLSMKCIAAGLSSFATLLDQLETGTMQRRPQDFTRRRYFSRNDRPDAAGRLDFSGDATTLAAQVRALDFGPLWNPVTTAKIEVAEQVLLVRHAQIGEAEAPASPGTVIERDNDSLVVATGNGALKLSGMSGSYGQDVDLEDLVNVGDILPSPTEQLRNQLNQNTQNCLTGETYWRAALHKMVPVTVPLAGPETAAPDWASIAVDLNKWLIGSAATAAVMSWAVECSGQGQADLAISNTTVAKAAHDLPGYVSGWVPTHVRMGETLTETVVRLERNLDRVQSCGGFAYDLIARDPLITQAVIPAVGVILGHSDPIPGTILTISLTGDYRATLFYDRTRISDADADRLSSRLEESRAPYSEPDGSQLSGGGQF